MIFKKINFKLIFITLLFFCILQIKCSHVIGKRSIMQDLMTNFMKIIDPKSNPKQNTPYKIIKSETIDGKVQKYFYTTPNLDDEKMKDINNAIKLLSIQSMLNRHYKNQYRKHKMMKELEYLNKGNENNENYKKLNEHTLKKYKYIDNFNNNRFNKEMLKLQKQAQKLIENSPELFKNVKDHHFFVQSPQENLNAGPEFYTNSHGPQQDLRSKHKNEQSPSIEQTPQVFLLSPNEIPPHPHKYNQESTKQNSLPVVGKHYSSGKKSSSQDHLKYFTHPISPEPFIRIEGVQPMNVQKQKHYPQELLHPNFVGPYSGPKDIPWSMKHKSPEVFFASQQEIPWSVVPLPPPLPTLNMGSSNNEYTWALKSLPPPLKVRDHKNSINEDLNSYWALKPLPPPMQAPFSSRDMKTSSSSIDLNTSSNEDMKQDSLSDPYVINTYSKNSALNTDISHENYEDLHITQESNLKSYTIDTRKNNESNKRDKDESQQLKQESTMQQYSINPILAQQYQRYNSQQKNLIKPNSNSTQSKNETLKHKDNSSNKFSNKRQEQAQSSTIQKENNVSTSNTFTRKYQPKNLTKQLINPEQAQNFNVNQEKVLQQRQQQLKQFYEKQKQQRQMIRNNNKNLLQEPKNIQDTGGRSYMFNSKLNTHHVATIPVDIAIPIEESDWIPIQPKFKVSKSTIDSEQKFLSPNDINLKSSNKKPISNVDVMLIFANETKVKDFKERSNVEVKVSDKESPQNLTQADSRRKIGNDELVNVDRTIKELTFNKPIYEVPLINNKKSVNSEKTIVLEMINSDLVKNKNNEINQVEDYEGSESNTVPIKVRYENHTKLFLNKDKYSSERPVRNYERVKVIKTKHKIYENIEISEKNKTNSHDENKSTVNIISVPNTAREYEPKLLNNETKNETLPTIDHRYEGEERPKSNISIMTTIKQDKKSDEEVLSDKNTEIFGEDNLEVLSMVGNTTQDDTTNIKDMLKSNEQATNGMKIKSQPNENFASAEFLGEYEPSSSNIRELIANRSKQMKPFFRSKQNLTLTTTSTTTTTTTTMKPIVIPSYSKPKQDAPKDQKYEESKTLSNYDDYDEHISNENIKAAQEFNFPKTDISYSINIPKSSQSVFKSVTDERIVSANRKPNNRQRNSERIRDRPIKYRDQNNYENREEQTYVTPTYDRDPAQYSVYENTNPFENGNTNYYQDDDSTNNEDVDLKNIRIPSPDEIDLDNIDIPNPETIAVKGVSSVQNEDGEKDEDGDDEDEDSAKDKDDEDGGDEDNGDDADNEESKTRKKIDKSLQQNIELQKPADSEKSHTEKHFDISSIPIPVFNEERMNHVKEKYNIPSANLENLQNRPEENDESNLHIPQDHLVKNEYNDEIPNYNIPLDESQEEHESVGRESNEGDHDYQNNRNFRGETSAYSPGLNMYTLNNEDQKFPFMSNRENYRLRNLLKTPIPDQFDEDKVFQYGKFSEESDNREGIFGEYEEGADKKQDPAINYNRFLNEYPSHQHLRQLSDVQVKNQGKITESHIVKQVPIAFKTIIKPVPFGGEHFVPRQNNIHKPNAVIQQPFRSYGGQDQTQLQRQLLYENFAYQQNYPRQYGQSQTAGRNLQSSIVPAMGYKMQENGEHFNIPSNENNQHIFQNVVPQYNHAELSSQANTEKDISTNFDSSAKIRSQLVNALPKTENSNDPAGQNIFSDPTKVRSFSNVNINRNIGPTIIPTVKNQKDNVFPFNSPIKSGQELNEKIKEGLVVYHPTKSQLKSVSHVHITPPTVEKRFRSKIQPQIQEKNFQYTNNNPNQQQKHVKIEVPRLLQQTISNPSLSQQHDVSRFRYLSPNSYNKNGQQQRTTTLQQINKQNKFPTKHARPHQPTNLQKSNNFRNIPVRSQNNENHRHQLPSPRPTFTLQQIQTIKNSNLPPHIREYNEMHGTKYEFPNVKNTEGTNVPYDHLKQSGYYKNHPILQVQQPQVDQHNQYFNQQAPRPYIGSHKTENPTYRTHHFGKYENGGVQLSINDKFPESDEDVNNSEENEENDERVRPRDPTHHDTESKEHYFDANSQDYNIENNYEIPNTNEFVQNIRLPSQIPKIEKLRVTNEFTNVNVNQYNKYHPDNSETHFLPTPTPEMHVTTKIKNKGKSKTLVFNPSEQEYHTKQIQLSTPRYNLQELSTPTYNVQQSSTPAHNLQEFSSPAYNLQELSTPSYNLQELSTPNYSLQTSTLSNPHFSPTPNSIPDHPTPLLSPQQYLAPTTPLSPPHFTHPHQQEHSSFIPSDRETILQIQSPISAAHGQLQPHQLHGHALPQSQLFGPPGEQRPQLYFDRQYQFEIPQQEQNIHNVPIHQPIPDHFRPPQGYVQHQTHHPHQQIQLPLGFPPNPDHLNNFDPHNPQPTPLQISQPQLNYPPQLEQYQLPEHHLQLEEQFYPLQNIHSQTRLIPTLFPHKKSDENHSNEQDDHYYGRKDSASNINHSGENYRTQGVNDDNSEQYNSSGKKENLDNSHESNQNSGELYEQFSAQSERRSSRTDNKIQFDYVDSKTRIQPQDVKKGNIEQDTKDSEDTIKRNNDDTEKSSSYSSNNKTVDDLVQRYVETYNDQESKQDEQISEPDFVIQKSLQTEYSLESKEEENAHEENRLPLNFVTPSPTSFVTPTPNQRGKIFHLPKHNSATDFQRNTNEEQHSTVKLNGPLGQSSPQVQHHHFTQHGTNPSHYHRTQQLNNNDIPILLHNRPSFEHQNVIYRNLQSESLIRFEKLNDLSGVLHNVPNNNNNNNNNKNDNNKVKTVFGSINPIAPSELRNQFHVIPDSNSGTLQHNKNQQNLFQNQLKTSPKSNTHNSNINPSHYFIKDSDMPTVSLNTEGIKSNDGQPHVRTYVQLSQPNGKINHGLPSALKAETSIVKAHDSNPLQISTQTQAIVNPSAQNEKIKIIIPTITQHHAPLGQHIHYKLPSSEVVINRFTENIKPISKPDAGNQIKTQHTAIPQPFQNKNIMQQSVFSNFNGQQNPIQQVRDHYTGHLSSQHSSQNSDSPSQTRYGQNFPSHQSLQEGVMNPNIQNFHNFQNIQLLNNQNHIQNIQPPNNQNHNLDKLPINHNNYDIFGEYGQRTQNKEPYRFESPSSPDHFNIYQSHNYNPQHTQIFQPIVMDFDNPQGNFYYNTIRSKNINGIKHPELAEPVKLPSNLVHGVESESLVNKITHPSIFDLSSDQSEQSVKKINITGTNVHNPHMKIKINNNNDSNTTKIKINQKSHINKTLKKDQKEELKPLLTYLILSENLKGNPLENKIYTNDQTTPGETDSLGSSREIMEKMETSNKNLTKIFQYKNNENNIPMLIVKPNESSQSNTQNQGDLPEYISPKADSKIHLIKDLETKIKIDQEYTRNQDEKYGKMDLLSDNIATFTDNFDIFQLSPINENEENGTEFLGFTDGINKARYTNSNDEFDSKYKNYVASLNQSYANIRQSMKTDDQDKINISGLYNNDRGDTSQNSLTGNNNNTRTSKQLNNIAHDKSNSNNKQNIAGTSQTQNSIENRPNSYGRSIDINYFNRRKNGHHSNENILDDRENKLNNSSSYAMRIINLLRSNNKPLDISNQNENMLELGLSHIGNTLGGVHVDDNEQIKTNKYLNHNGHSHSFDLLEMLANSNKDNNDEFIMNLLRSDNVSHKQNEERTDLKSVLEHNKYLHKHYNER